LQVLSSKHKKVEVKESESSKENKKMQVSNATIVESIFDAINNAFTFENKQFRTIIAGEDIWFCGKDIAKILEYKDTKKALQNHVSEKYKKSYSEIYESLGGVQTIPHLNKPSYNGGLAIYVTEAGLYELLFSSKLPIAIKFKEHVFEFVLPSMRKMGQQKYLDEIAQLKKKQLNLTSFVENHKFLEKEQIFYLMTTKAYAENNRFEYGGVKNINELKNRLSGYNTGRAEGDLMYICKIIKCNSYKLIEERINNVAQRFKDKLGSRKEMVHMRYNRLEEVIDFICEHYNYEIDFINARCKEIFDETINNEPIIPSAIDPKDLGDYMEVTVNQSGIKKTKKIDITGWSEDKINKALEEIITICGKTKYPNYEFAAHKNDTPLDLTWSDISSKIKATYKVVSMSEWRVKFNTWYNSESPEKLKIKGIRI
jgi:prophage antirepressor-like protein